MATPQFSLYGPTPSAASVQQMPLASYYSDQNNLNERNRVAAIIASLQLQEQQDRQDAAERRTDVARSIDLSNYNRDLGERRRVEAENTRRFNIGFASDREKLAEDKRRFGITSELSRARLPEYETPETPAERLAAQRETLQTETARVIAKNLSDLVNVKRANNPQYFPTPDDERTASALTPFQRSLIIQSLAEKTGSLDPSLRWDDDARTWTDQPAVSRGFSPIMGRLREAEGSMELPRVTSASPINFRNFSGGRPQASLPTSNEVIRLTKDGRRAIFDANTKSFLRYAD